MRMWMVPPWMLCDKHLLGEHVECHMLLSCLENKKNLDGYLEKRIIAPSAVCSRHDALMMEMTRRGMNHNSPIGPMPNISYLGDKMDTSVEFSTSALDLTRRCKECAERRKRHLAEAMGLSSD